MIAAGCAEKGSGISEIRITPSITRVTGVHFDKEDCIGLTVLRGADTYVENKMMTYDGSVFAASGLLWYNDLNEKSTLTAYYPYAESGAPAEFTIAADQTGGTAGSDLLAAVTKEVTPAAAPVGMMFYHLMSQVKIVITNTSGTEVTGVTVSGSVPVAEVDFSVPTAIAKSGAATAAVKAQEVAVGTSYNAILVPQTVALTITVATADGNDRSKTTALSTLESGRRYDLTVAVTNIDISLSLSGDIHDWEEGGQIGDGGGEQTEGIITYENEDYRIRKIGSKMWMVDNLRFIPAGKVPGVEYSSPIKYPNNNPEGVATEGLLYNFATAMGITSGASDAPVRGICPEGWHIPNKDELDALAAAEYGSDFLQYCSGYWPENNFLAGRAYLMGSTRVPDENKYYCLKYSPTEPLNAVNVDERFFISVRCVKDSK